VIAHARLPSGPDADPEDLPAICRVIQVCSMETSDVGPTTCNAKACVGWDISLDGGEAPLALPALTHTKAIYLLSQT